MPSPSAEGPAMTGGVEREENGTLTTGLRTHGASGKLRYHRLVGVESRKWLQSIAMRCLMFLANS